jgi:Tfp pilus assembly protein PilO
MEDILVILLLFGSGAIVAVGFSPLGRALADRIRGRPVAQDAEELRAELAEAREVHAEELQQVRQEVADLAERLDFAERMLAQQREAPRVGPGGER